MKYKIKLMSKAASMGLEDVMDKEYEGRPIVVAQGQFLSISFPNGNRVYLNAEQVIGCFVEVVNPPAKPQVSKRSQPEPSGEELDG